MEDAELERIRAQRLAQLQQGNGGNGGQRPQQQDAERAQQQQEEIRQTMMTRILTQSARERLARIRIVRPDRASGVEEMLIRMAQSGQIRGKVDEDDLKGLLEEISKHQDDGGDRNNDRPQIVYSRRELDDDDDLDDI